MDKDTLDLRAGARGVQFAGDTVHYRPPAEDRLEREQVGQRRAQGRERQIGHAFGGELACRLGAVAHGAPTQGREPEPGTGGSGVMTTMHQHANPHIGAQPGRE